MRWIRLRRTLLVEVQVPNPDGKLLPGMYVRGGSESSAQGSAAADFRRHVGGAARGHAGSRCSNANNVVHFQRVIVGRDLGDRIEVLSGLTEGQRAIVNPNDSVQEGVKVSPVPAGPTAGSSKRPAKH